MKTFIPRFYLGVAILILIAAPIASSQEQQTIPPQPPQRVVISFLAQIDSNTVNLLIAIVNNQIRGGVKNITIVISSTGGDPTAAFAAYNILRSLPADITTFNAGITDSAAMLIYCAGKHRYSLPTPARFLIHGTSMTVNTAGLQMDTAFLESQLMQVKSANEMLIQVITAASNRKREEIAKTVTGQTILSPEEARQWGIVQEIRTSFMEPGATFISVNATIPPTEEKRPIKFGTPGTIASETKH
ncbi:MAG: ATP-dependent Clp protease, protease subunit [Blastocatellia bacterium]|jgi:ATP-dependent Clp protease protease subunit|nr:ATP-dependent Clp protease, protease subunit [Blastocatellia bacterium]